jgi:hypothetical protein
MLFLLLPPDFAPVGEEQELPQRVQGLAIAEVGVDPAPELLTLQVPQDEDGLRGTAKAPILLANSPWAT